MIYLNIIMNFIRLITFLFLMYNTEYEYCIVSYNKRLYLSKLTNNT